MVSNNRRTSERSVRTGSYFLGLSLGSLGRAIIGVPHERTVRGGSDFVWCSLTMSSCSLHVSALVEIKVVANRRISDSMFDALLLT